jgi:hypothetical protein
LKNLDRLQNRQSSSRRIAHSHGTSSIGTVSRVTAPRRAKV